jgi:hypothetical protein
MNTIDFHIPPSYFYRFKSNIMQVKSARWPTLFSSNPPPFPLDILSSFYGARGLFITRLVTIVFSVFSLTYAQFITSRTHVHGRFSIRTVPFWVSS